jgi:hypothetical protein
MSFPTLLNAGVEVVVLTDDDTKDKIAVARFTPRSHISKACASNRPTTTPKRSARACNGCSATCAASAARAASTPKPWTATSGKCGRERLEVPPGHLDSLRADDSPPAEFFVGAQTSGADAKPLHPTPGLYTDLFDKYQPDMVIASTPGWRMDRYLLRESARRGIPNMTVIVGWDNSSSLQRQRRGCAVGTCWSQLQKDELVNGSDWNPEHVNIGGIPSYDGYFRKQWLMPRDEYFKLHGLDPNRKLISYASSFVHFAPNFPNIEALAKAGFVRCTGRTFAVVDPPCTRVTFKTSRRFCRRTRAGL